MAKSFKIIKLVSEFWNTTAPISHCLLSSNFKSTASTGHYLGVEGDQLVVQIDWLYRTMDTILKETNLLSKSTVSTGQWTILLSKSTASTGHWQWTLYWRRLTCCPNRLSLLDNLVVQIERLYWTMDNTLGLKETSLFSKSTHPTEQRTMDNTLGLKETSLLSTGMSLLPSWESSTLMLGWVVVHGITAVSY